MTDLRTDLLNSFKQGSHLTKLIYINLGFFLLYYLIRIIDTLFVLNSSNLFAYIYFPSYFPGFLNKPWTLITYMFWHESFIHILFNILNLYWFGRLFLSFFNQKQLVALYFLGGIFGAGTYMLAYNIFPYFANYLPVSTLHGASASVLAIIMAVAVYQPNLELQVLLIGRLKIKYVAIFLFFISFFSVVGENAGGNFAHLGGIFAGFLFARFIKNGKDLTTGFNRIIDFFVDLFARKPKMKVKRGQRPLSDEQWNQNKHDENRQIDQILDKIKKSGYESLSAEEKKLLFDQRSKT